MIFSCVIPCKGEKSRSVQELISSIRAQDFPQDEIEVITVTEGDSESAKSIGIRRASGDILVMLCGDNYFLNEDTFEAVYGILSENSGIVGAFSRHYAVHQNDPSLNRYFALIGANDIIAYYLGKADRKPWYDSEDYIIYDVISYPYKIPSLGCNGFFVKAEYFKKADLDHYYPMDACEDIRRKGHYTYARLEDGGMWHRTYDSVLSFFKKRFIYADKLYVERNDRRWAMVEPKDLPKLILFIIYTITLIQPLCVSLRGYLKVRDLAWFWHLPICWLFLITYSILCLKRLLLYPRTAGKALFKSV